MSCVTLVTNTITTVDALGSGPLPQPLGFCWLDFFDLLGEGILMPLGSLIIVILVGWVWKLDFIDKEVSIEGNQLKGHGFWNLCYKITAPLGMAMILLGQIDGFFGLGIFG
jgi:NSS family neurotransmitter:Na+ symporter